MLLWTVNYNFVMKSFQEKISILTNSRFIVLPKIFRCWALKFTSTQPNWWKIRNEIMWTFRNDWEYCRVKMDSEYSQCTHICRMVLGIEFCGCKAAQNALTLALKQIYFIHNFRNGLEGNFGFVVWSSNRVTQCFMLRHPERLSMLLLFFR